MFFHQGSWVRQLFSIWMQCTKQQLLIGFSSFGTATENVFWLTPGWHLQNTMHCDLSSLAMNKLLTIFWKNFCKFSQSDVPVWNLCLWHQPLIIHFFIHVKTCCFCYLFKGLLRTFWNWHCDEDGEVFGTFPFLPWFHNGGANLFSKTYDWKNNRNQNQSKPYTLKFRCQASDFARYFIFISNFPIGHWRSRVLCICSALLFILTLLIGMDGWQIFFWAGQLRSTWHLFSSPNPPLPLLY